MSDSSQDITSYISPPSSPFVKKSRITCYDSPTPSQRERAIIDCIRTPPSSPSSTASTNIINVHSPISSKGQQSHSITRSLFRTPHSSQASTTSTAYISDVSSPTPSQLKRTAMIPKRRLVEQLKRTLTQYNASVRNWEYSMKRNQNRTQINPEDEVLNLLIERCVIMPSGKGSPGTADGKSTILTLCYNLALDGNKNPSSNECHLTTNHQWVIFKPKSDEDIFEGSLIKLYRPWQEIFLPRIGECVIYCSDFYKVSTSKEMKLSLNVSSFLENRTLLLDKLVSDVVTRNFDGSPWQILVPYSLQNVNTVTKEVLSRRTWIEIDVVICQIWTNQSDQSVQLLVKDSDNFLALVGGISNQHALIDSLRPGVFCKLNKLILVDKITPKTWLPLFSVIATFNASQAQLYKYYYKLWFSIESTFEIVPFLDISFTEPDCPILSVLQLSLFPKNIDSRFITKGVLEETSDSETLLTDSSGKMKIRVLSSFGFSRIIFREQVVLTFLRMFRGICTLDQFSFMQRETFSDSVGAFLL